MSLAKLIIERIKEQGPVSFRDFMEMSLYHPGLGYYHADRDKVGESGDFYTSPCLGSLFGDMIARQLEEMWIQAGKTAFTLVEYGARTGLLCRDILRALRTNMELYDRLHYYIIEKSAFMREKERSILQETDGSGLQEKVSWLESIGDIPPITGCILSNELIDNFSVHRVVMEDELMEVFVDYDGAFAELLRPAGQALKEYLDELQGIL